MHLRLGTACIHVGSEACGLAISLSIGICIGFCVAFSTVTLPIPFSISFPVLVLTSTHMYMSVSACHDM